MGQLLSGLSWTWAGRATATLGPATWLPAGAHPPLPLSSEEAKRMVQASRRECLGSLGEPAGETL